MECDRGLEHKRGTQHEMHGNMIGKQHTYSCSMCAERRLMNPSLARHSRVACRQERSPLSSIAALLSHQSSTSQEISLLPQVSWYELQKHCKHARLALQCMEGLRDVAHIVQQHFACAVDVMSSRDADASQAFRSTFPCLGWIIKNRGRHSEQQSSVD